jgi:beta-mannosidase
MRRAITLSGFHLTSTDTGAGRPEGPEGPEWIDAVVPGGVHESLLAAGRIPHPYRDRHEGDIRWVEDRDWWFRTDFAGPEDVEEGDRVTLVCHGLDTVVELWLNGEPLGRHENMFRPAEFDVTGRLNNSNELLMRFSPPLAGLTVPRSATDMFERLGDVFASISDEGGGEGVLGDTLGLATLRRKATFSWGWDFGPRVPSIGIWRPVDLVHERGAVLTGHHIRTESINDDGSATVNVTVEGTEDLVAAVTLTSPSGVATAVDVPTNTTVTVTVPDADLWWTHDLGSPALYDVTVTIPGDERTDRVGLRTIELDRGDDPEGGRLFRFRLNGFPIFARGANWLPASMLVGSVPATRYRELVALARDGDMNMLRVWGGGVYEHDAFYETCDELGVLIWHDFMFACCDYPSEDPTLRREVELEARYQTTRLRNRACMALWCGNNEVQMVHGFAYQNYEPGNWGWDFFYRILPEAADKSGVPYWPGSPWGEAAEEGFMATNGVLDGDRHAWEVWHGMDFGAGGGEYASIGEARHYHRYGLDRGKFISEFGVHAAPELSTLDRWISDDLSVHSATFDHHNKDHPKNKGDALLEIITGLPESVEEYVDFTMVSQAEALKFGIEHYRRRQPHNSGTLIWQFNDVWPGFSWSIVDHDTVPKAGYYFAKRTFAPVLASFRRDGSRLELWVSNSGRAAREVTAEVTLESFEGRAQLSVTVVATVPAAGSQCVWTHESDDLTPDRFAWVTSPTDDFPTNRLFFAEIKDLPLVTPDLRVTVIAQDEETAILDLEADRFAYLVRIPSPAPGTRFSDNYVTLRAGDRARIEVTGLPPGLSPEALRAHAYVGTKR